jgi:hypothetical protein
MQCINTAGMTIFGERKSIKGGTATNGKPNPVNPVIILAKKIASDPAIIKVVVNNIFLSSVFNKI